MLAMFCIAQNGEYTVEKAHAQSTFEAALYVNILLALPTLIEHRLNVW